MHDCVVRHGWCCAVKAPVVSAFCCLAIYVPHHDALFSCTADRLDSKTEEYDIDACHNSEKDTLLHVLLKDPEAPAVLVAQVVRCAANLAMQNGAGLTPLDLTMSARTDQAVAVVRNMDVKYLSGKWFGGKPLLEAAQVLPMSLCSFGWMLAEHQRRRIFTQLGMTRQAAVVLHKRMRAWQQLHVQHIVHERIRRAASGLASMAHFTSAHRFSVSSDNPACAQSAN